MITGMSHAGFVVRDLERSVRFYRDVIGLKVRYSAERSGEPISQVVGYENTHLKAVHLATGDGPTLELVQYLSPPPSARPSEERSVEGASHVAFNVDGIYDTYEMLVTSGAKKLNPPVELVPGRTVCYLQDPDGNWIELVEIKE